VRCTPDLATVRDPRGGTLGVRGSLLPFRVSTARPARRRRKKDDKIFAGVGRKNARTVRNFPKDENWILNLLGTATPGKKNLILRTTYVRDHPGTGGKIEDASQKRW